MEDANLLDGMKGRFSSSNEEAFFHNMVWKEVYEWAGCCDVILSAFDNEDEIFIVRYYDAEYKVGKGREVCHKKRGGYFDCLSDALKFDMWPLVGENVTLLEWLRRRDYEGVKYDNNEDY